MKKGVIYTAIFGGKDLLHEPKYVPDDFDFVCFTDNKKFRSEIWDIRYVEAPFRDPVRCARYYKILTHKFLSDYDYSVWIDGNMIVTGDVSKLVRKYLQEVSLAVYNHANQKHRIMKLFWLRDKKFARNCIYKESEDLIRRTQAGFYMDDPETIKKQMQKYKNEGYPKNNGLAVTMILLRRHNESNIKETMEDWWDEIYNHSRRDQLSFNYVAWKNNLPFNYIKGDPKYNKYFSKVKHRLKDNYRK